MGTLKVSKADLEFHLQCTIIPPDSHRHFRIIPQTSPAFSFSHPIANMAPSATIAVGNGTTNGHQKDATVSVNTLKEPMKSNGSLDDYEKIQLAPIIGTEFTKANLVDMMNAPNSGELLAELAYTSIPPLFAIPSIGIQHH